MFSRLKYCSAILLMGLAVTVLFSCSGENPVRPPASIDDVELTGRWEAESVIPGSVEYYWFEFRDDGSMQYGEKGVSEIIGDKTYDGTYAVEGNMITISLPTYTTPELANANVEYEITSDGQFWFPNKNDGSWGSVQFFEKFIKVGQPGPGDPSTPDEPGSEKLAVTLIIDGYAFPDGENSKSIQVNHGSLLEEIQIPETGLVFGETSTWGWYEEGADAPFTGNINSNLTLYLKWSGGVTTEIDGVKTYLVKDADGLYAWRNEAVDNPTIGCLLLANIALPVEAVDVSNWDSPFNDTNIQFRGVFEGNGYTISNIQNLDSGRGLIGAVAEEGIVQNVSLENATIIGLAYTAGIASYNNGTIRNCSFSGFVQSTFHSGGIAGLNGETGIIEGCIVDANLSMESETGYTGASLGGIVADNDGGIIIGCSSSGEVISNAIYTDDYIGGVVGENKNNGVVIACVSDAAVGYNRKHDKDLTRIGGLCGRNLDGAVVQSCYFIGEIDAPFGSGGAHLLGSILSNGEIRNCFWEGGSTYIGYPYQPNIIEDVGRVPEKLPWSDATGLLNEGIEAWNNSNPNHPCNFEFVQQSLLSRPDLTAKE